MRSTRRRAAKSAGITGESEAFCSLLRLRLVCDTAGGISRMRPSLPNASFPEICGGTPQMAGETPALPEAVKDSGDNEKTLASITPTPVSRIAFAFSEAAISMGGSADFSPT